MANDSPPELPSDAAEVGELMDWLYRRTVGFSFNSRRDGKRGCYVTVDLPTGPGASTTTRSEFEGESIERALRKAYKHVRERIP